MFWGIFDHTPSGEEVSEQPLPVRQGKSCAATFDLKFHTVATESGDWNEPVLKAVFHQGVNNDLHKEFACRDDEA